MEILDLNDDADSSAESQKEEKELEKIDEPVEEKPKRSVRRELLSWCLNFAIAFAAAICIRNYVIINANVPSGSMESTIMPGDNLIGLRLAYTFSEPKRGDIIIFTPPEGASNPGEKYIKRIIGLPGETVEVKDGKVYINGEYLEEDYLDEAHCTGTKNPGPYTFQVPEDSYLVFGDNRDNSNDAREWVTMPEVESPYISRDDIIAKALFIYYPFNHLGGLN